LTAAEERIGGAGDLSATIQAAQSGDEDAFRRIYRRIQPALLRYARVLVGSDAEDVTSETWLQIARGFGSFTGGEDEFRAWSATIMRNRALDHLRQARRRPVIALPDEILAELNTYPDTADQALRKLASQRALRMIASLPPDQAEAVLLRVVMGLDANSAAQVLGKRSGAVRTAAYRGLRRLGEMLHAEQRRDMIPQQRDPDHGGRV
jgi:RNA polymerase sigma-70 factor (ECF subfamily)